MRNKIGTRYRVPGTWVLLMMLLLASAAWAGTKAPTDNNDLAAVLKSGQPVIVKLGAEWCPPCRAMKPELKALAAEQKGKMIVLDLDIEKNRPLAQQYKVTLIPTILYYAKSGQFKDKTTGFISKGDMLKKARELGLIK